MSLPAMLFVQRLRSVLSSRLLLKPFLTTEAASTILGSRRLDRRIFHTTICGMSSALIIVVEDAEEMETIIPADVLRRAGINVTLAGLIGSGPIRCSRNITIVPDSSLDEAVSKGPYDIVIIPGGKGSQILCSSEQVGSILKDQEKRKGYIGAICAGPTVLMSHGIGEGKKITSHPAVTEKIVNSGMFTYSEDRVVTDDKIITSRGPGTAFEFAIEIVKLLKDQQCVDDIKPAMMLNF